MGIPWRCGQMTGFIPVKTIIHTFPAKTKAAEAVMGQLIFPVSMMSPLPRRIIGPFRLFQRFSFSKYRSFPDKRCDVSYPEKSGAVSP